MRLPRWTVWPALAVLAVFVLPAIPRARAPRPEETGLVRSEEAKPRLSAPRESRYKRVVVLGIDGMDPELLQETVAKYPDRMSNFQRLIQRGGIHSIETSTPPQSPVAWSNFITGFDPGGHGVFDFIHRDPMTRAPAPSTTKSSPSSHVSLWGDWQFPLGGSSEPNRTGKPFWQILADHGVPADIWRMPANFPVEPAEGLSFSGMMTPAVDSAYGEFSFFTTNPPAQSFLGEGKLVSVREYDGLIETAIQGPENTFKQGSPHVTVPLRIYIDRESNAAALDTGAQVIVLRPGQWSDFTRLSFELLPMGLTSIGGTIRFYLRSLDPDFELYASPVNIDPIDPVTPVSEPVSASAEVAEAIGLYYTQGMPEDVNALKKRVLTDPEFMEQSELVHDEGVRMMDYALDEYLKDDAGGFLFFYFSGVDLCSHMMWRHFDAAHPFHDASFASKSSTAWSQRPGSRWEDVVYDLYMHMDPVLGRLLERVGDQTLVIVMSDHGFASYRRKFSLNTWLYDNGYLVLRDGRTKELARNDPSFAPVEVMLPSDAVDWSRTRAYGIGFNGLYLNLAGRELDDPATPADESGIVQRGPQADALLRELAKKLEAVVDPKTGERVILRCDLASEVYTGPRTPEAPDLLVGYNANYGNSDQASLGRITHEALEDNLGGTFNGNHLMAPEVVPGVLLTNGAVTNGKHGLADLTVEILKQYGITPGPGMRGAPVLR